MYRNQSEVLARNGISHLWKSRSAVNVHLCSRLKAAAKTQISRGCKLQDASKSSNLALMSFIEKLSPVSFEPNINHCGFDSNSSFLFLNARRNSLMLHAFLVLAAGLPQVLLRTQYRVWMPADAKAAHVKPQHA